MTSEAEVLHESRLQNGRVDAEGSQKNSFRCVIPAFAGIQALSLDNCWTPAEAGVTVAGSGTFADPEDVTAGRFVLLYLYLGKERVSK